MKLKPYMIGFIVAICIGLTGLLVRYSFPGTPAIRSAKGIASLQKVSIGGAEQWLLIRGNDRSKPVLLFLHGGPGFAEMPFCRQINTGLERDFVVVNWDQRGAGKSYDEALDPKTVSTKQFLAEAPYKEYIEYIYSTHTTNFEEPKQFNRVMT